MGATFSFLDKHGASFISHVSCRSRRQPTSPAPGTRGRRSASAPFPAPGTRRREKVKKMREEYGKLNRGEMSIWECCELLNEFVDESDADRDEPQIEHLLQTAEAIRKDYPDEDWLHLTSLIHVVGDTFPVGCAFDESNVHHKYFKENPDFGNSKYNTKFGVYSEGCGLDNVLMSWGHDDYMYLVAKKNKTTLPSAGFSSSDIIFKRVGFSWTRIPLL